MGGSSVLKLLATLDVVLTAGGIAALATVRATPTWYQTLRRRHAELAVDRQEADPRSTLACTRRLVALRRAEPALRTGAVRFLDLPEPLLGFDRSKGTRRIRCIFNVSSQRVSVGNEWLGSATPLAAEGYSPGSGTLEPFGFCTAAIDAT